MIKKNHIIILVVLLLLFVTLFSDNYIKAEEIVSNELYSDELNFENVTDSNIKAVTGSSIEFIPNNTIEVVTGSAITVTGSAIYIKLDTVNTYEHLEQLADGEYNFYDIGELRLELDGNLEVSRALDILNKLYNSKNVTYINKVYLTFYNYATLMKISDFGVGEYKSIVPERFKLLFEGGGSLEDIILDENMERLVGNSKFVVNDIEYKEEKGSSRPQRLGMMSMQSTCPRVDKNGDGVFNLEDMNVVYKARESESSINYNIYTYYCPSCGNQVYRVYEQRNSENRKKESLMLGLKEEFSEHTIELFPEWDNLLVIEMKRSWDTDRWEDTMFNLYIKKALTGQVLYHIKAEAEEDVKDEGYNARFGGWVYYTTYKKDGSGKYVIDKDVNYGVYYGWDYEGRDRDNYYAYVGTMTARIYEEVRSRLEYNYGYIFNENSYERNRGGDNWWLNNKYYTYTSIARYIGEELTDAIGEAFTRLYIVQPVQQSALPFYNSYENTEAGQSLIIWIPFNLIKSLERLTVTPSKTEIYYGQTVNYTYTAQYSNGETKVLSGGELASIVNTKALNNTLIGNQLVEFRYSENGVSVLASTTIKVKEGLDSITPTLSTQTIYKGELPTLSATAKYLDGTANRVVTPINNFSGEIGTHTVTLTYTEKGATKSANCTVTVKPNLIGIDVLPDNYSVLYDEDISFTVKATYEDDSYETVSATCTQAYSKTTVGTQIIKYSYTENGITKSASVNVTVKDYPVFLDITLDKYSIYQGEDISVINSVVTLASGTTTKITPTFSEYDNVSLGNKDITFFYTLNDISVSLIKSIDVLADLYKIEINSDDFTIYRGQNLDIDVTAYFNIVGTLKLNAGDFTITDFDNNKYDKSGNYYNVTYSNKGVTVTKAIFIRVLPNIVDLSVSADPQTTEGVFVPFVINITYEDGSIKTITQNDIYNELNLLISNYDINKVGYQDVQFSYSEGENTLTKTINVRVRAIINVSIPISMLITIDPNQNDLIASDILIINSSKESVLVSINSIQNSSDSLNDVLPNKHENWSNLGLKHSKDIALGLRTKSNWLNNYLTSPLYVAEVDNSKDIGIIDINETASLEVVANYCNSQSTNKIFTYIIGWNVKLSDD